MTGLLPSFALFLMSFCFFIPKAANLEMKYEQNKYVCIGKLE